jgi:ectoine hydroxylase-related dioxygenase (phytanoyl-CoA dioxygenase family)
LELARHLIGDGMQMAEVGAVWNKPGAPAGGLHADVPVGWFASAGRPIPDTCFMVNCIWMLTEFTRENGATLLLPFSHHSRRVPRPGVQYRHLVAAEGPPGSIVIFHGAIWHGSGANTTRDSQRLGVSSGFHAHWMDPSAGGWHLLTREVRDRMPPEVQAMNRQVVERPGQMIG